MGMADFGSVISELEGEENLIAATKQILRALGSKNSLTCDTRKILLDLGSQLSRIAIVDEAKVGKIKEIEDHLDEVQKKIMSWEEDQPLIWNSDSSISEYLSAAEEASMLIEKLEGYSFNGDGNKNVLRKAEDVLQIAMAKLEEQFKIMPFENRQPLESELMSFRSSEEYTLDERSSSLPGRFF